MGNTCKADETGQIAEKSHCKSILFIAAQKEQCYTQTTSKGKTRIEGGVKNATAKDKDGIRWSKNIKEPVARRIECRGFTNQLYKMWEWDSDFVYRTSGRLVIADKKVMLLYDFSSPESWKFREKEKVK